MNTHLTQRGSIESGLARRIRGTGRGFVFTPSHFLDLGSRAAVDQALSRMAATGRIRRLARGLYDYPRHHRVLGELQPSAETIAKALSARDATRLQPAGAYAANLLGLTEQVPAKVVFLTDGASRIVVVGKQTIVLKRTTPRNMAASGRLSGLIIQALRHIGQRHVTEKTVTALQPRVPAEAREGLLRDLRLAPAWMHPLLRLIAVPEGSGTRHAP
jgi:hypothetical protein